VRGALLDDALPTAAEIVADVRARGDAALVEWTERLDGGRPAAIRVPLDALAAATLDAASAEALRRLAAAVYEFNAVQRPEDTAVEAFSGISAERRFLPLDSVGIYVPGGRAPLVSSLVMTAVPARVAGVSRIAVASPNPPDGLLAAARELEIDEVYAVGGAQAIAALAYGTETVRPVDKIVGPGNPWVTAAKLLVSTRVAIDLPAGPSEVLVIADESADPALCAADLLAQAEHGPDSEVILLTTSERVAGEVRGLTGGRAEVELVPTLTDALARANDYAPEHLQLVVEDPEAALAEVRNAGTVFLGPAASAVVGDYAAGATHVLPTGGLARGAGGLGLDAFLKPVQVVRASGDGLAGVRDLVAALADLEGLPLHAAAIEARFAAVP
jgi:histidinol dehydrogenase